MHGRQEEAAERQGIRTVSTGMDTRSMKRLIIGEAELKCRAKWTVCVGLGRFLGYDLGF